MTIREATKLFRQLLSVYFQNATVTHSKHSNVVKPVQPLVKLSLISAGERPLNPPTEFVDGHFIASYPTTATFQIDLFTKGAEIDVPDGYIAPSENTALNDMIDLLNFLGSEYVVIWCNQHDVALQPNGIPQDTSALINGSSYEFRSTVEISFSFTQPAIGYAGILDEDSIHVTQVPNEDTGRDDDSINIERVFNQTASGGGSDELASEISGYFTSAEIKEET